MGIQLPLPQRGTDPQFSPHICCGQMAGWIKMPLGMEVGLGPGDGDTASHPYQVGIFIIQPFGLSDLRND